MAHYTTSLFVILPLILSMAATGRCSWISGGAPPPPVSTGDYVTVGDDLLFEEKASTSGSSAPGPKASESEEDEESDESASGPSSDDSEESDEIAPGPGFKVQGKAAANEKASDNTFIIQGKVYCDPCRIQFPTKISYALQGTKVTLLCHKEGGGQETYRLETTSNEKGKYTFNAVGDHAEEICEISVSESPDPNCPEIMEDENHVRVSLTNKHGANGKGRYANPLGFMVRDADPRCKEALDELGFTGI